MKKYLLLLLLSSQAFATNLSTLRTSTRLLVRDTGSVRMRYSDSQINLLLNEAQKQIASRTFCARKSYSFPLVAGTTYYALPVDYISMARLSRDLLELKEMTPAGLDGRSRSWESSSGLPTSYFINFSSRSKVGFAPFPATSVDTGTIKMDYIAYFSTMTADSDSAFDGLNAFQGYDVGLPYFAAGILSSLDGKQQIAATFFALFEGYIKTLSEKCLWRDNYNPSAVGRQ